MLPEQKIGNFLAVGCELNEDEIGLYIASVDVSTSCAFKFEEWEKFVKGIKDSILAFRVGKYLEVKDIIRKLEKFYGFEWSGETLIYKTVKDH